MFFFGVLSTQLTYFLIVVVYICGYGTLALKSDKGDLTSLTGLKIELNEKFDTQYNTESTKDYIQTAQAHHNSNNKLIKAQNILFNKKQIPLCFNEQVINRYHAHFITSRPPPFTV